MKAVTRTAVIRATCDVKYWDVLWGVGGEPGQRRTANIRQKSVTKIILWANEVLDPAGEGGGGGDSGEGAWVAIIEDWQ